MLAFASSYSEAAKNLINACWNVLLHKAQRESVGHFGVGSDVSYAISLFKPCART